VTGVFTFLAKNFGLGSSALDVETRVPSTGKYCYHTLLRVTVNRPGIPHSTQILPHFKEECCRRRSMFCGQGIIH